MTTCLALALALAVAVLVPPDAVADLLESIEQDLPHFETTFEVDTWYARTEEDPTWDGLDPDRTETVDMLVSGGMVRATQTKEDGRVLLTTWDGAANTIRVGDGEQTQIIIKPRLQLPADFGTQECLRFNRVTARFPVPGRLADRVRETEVLAQSIDDGVLTHEWIHRSENICQVDTVVIRLEPEPRLLRWSTVMGRTPDPARVREHLIMAVTTEYAQWETHGGVSLPARVVRDGVSTAEEPGTGVRVTHSGRTAFRRTRFVDRSGDPPPADAFTIPLVPGARVLDERNDVHMVVGGRELTGRRVRFEFDDPIADLPGDDLAVVAVRGHVSMGRGVEPFGSNPTISPLPTGGLGDPSRAALARLERSRPEIVPGGTLDELMRTVETRSAWHAQRADLIGALLATEPAAPELATLLPYRWKYADLVPGIDVAAEVQDLARTHPEANEARTAGAYWSAAHRIVDPGAAAAGREGAADLFISRHPGDPRGGRLLTLAWLATPDPVAADRLQRRVAAEFADTFEGRAIFAELREVEAVGELVEFAFTDRLGGTRIDMADLRGKVVAINFWATWCGPCVGSMPYYLEHYRNLKKRYGDRFEMIGVALDVDPRKVVEFCRENEIPWPQLCEEGRAWNTSVARTFGVNAIPRTIIVDGEGQVRNTRARGLNFLYDDVVNVIGRE